MSSKFVAAINAHDVNGLIDLMTDDHVFVDSLGHQITRPGIEEGWKQYFEMVPDYWIKVDSSVEQGDSSILIGSAGGTWLPPGGELKPENEWRAPAVWIASLRGGKVSKWQVYCDNEPFREKMRQT